MMTQERRFDMIYDQAKDTAAKAQKEQAYKEAQLALLTSPKRRPTMKNVAARTEHLRDAIAATLAAVRDLPALLAMYESTGDHDHGHGRLSPGAPCPGGDCLVAAARRLVPSKDLLVAALSDVTPEEARAVWQALAATVENEEADESPSKHHAAAAALCARLDDAAMVETHTAAAEIPAPERRSAEDPLNPRARAAYLAHVLAEYGYEQTAQLFLVETREQGLDAIRGILRDPALLASEAIDHVTHVWAVWRGLIRSTHAAVPGDEPAGAEKEEETHS